MKKRTLIVLTIAVSLLMATAVMAATYSNPAQIISELTGKSEADVTARRTQGVTYGQLAQEDGVLDQFKSNMLEYKKEIIDERVSQGIITEEQGANIKKAMEERISACTGTPDPNRERLGQKSGGGLRFGAGQGQGQGQGFGGRGMGRGFGNARVTSN